MQVTDSKTRFYIEDLPTDFLPGLTHFGAMHNRQAIPALDDHVHSGAMEICYVHSGTACFEVNNREYHLSGGDIFLTFPDEPHSTGHSALGLMTLYWRGVRLDQLEVVAAEQKHRQPALSPAIQRVISHLEAHPGANVPVGQMARLAGLSVPRFHARFKIETGFPPKQWLMEQRMKLAESRLIQGQSVTRVALDLGFPSSQHFATMFRNYRGIAPSSLRRPL